MVTGLNLCFYTKGAVTWYDKRHVLEKMVYSENQYFERFKYDYSVDSAVLMVFETFANIDFHLLSNHFFAKIMLCHSMSQHLK